MNKYVFAALSIAVAIGPASALDAGLDGKAGGIGVGADVGVGREGASLGGGASADGVGGANLGGSVGTGNGAPSASDGGSSGETPLLESSSSSAMSRTAFCHRKARRKRL